MLGDEISYLPPHLLHGRMVELQRQRRRRAGSAGAECRHSAAGRAFRLWLRLRLRCLRDLLRARGPCGSRRRSGLRDNGRLGRRGFGDWGLRRHGGLCDWRRRCGRWLQRWMRRAGRLERRQRMLAGPATFSRRLSFGHQLVERRFRFREQTCVLRVAHGKCAFLLGAEQVLGFRGRSVCHWCFNLPIQSARARTARDPTSFALPAPVATRSHRSSSRI